MKQKIGLKAVWLPANYHRKLKEYCFKPGQRILMQDALCYAIDTLINPK